MESNEYRDLVARLDKDFVLISKGRLWTAIGGFIGVLLATGLVSYGASVQAVKESAAADALAKVNRFAEEAENNSRKIAEILDATPHKEFVG